MTTTKLLAACAAALFALGSGVPSDAAEGKVRCGGINSCKGTSACKTALSSCKGQNSCKGLGWTETATASDCVAKGGNVK